MKKPVFAILLSALFALSLPACKEQGSPLVSPTADPASKITASPAPSEKLTEVPTETPTEEPTEAPTDEPIPKTIPYDRGEYDTLLAFFELADENGVKNGEKCFKDYDPSKVDFWGTNPEDLINTKESYLTWNDEGKLSSLVLRGGEDSIQRLKGALMLNGFTELSKLRPHSFDFETVTIENCPNLRDIAFSCSGEASLIGDSIWKYFGVFSDTHCHYESTGKGAPVSPESHAFTVELAIEGNGTAGVYGYSDEHYYVVFIQAEAHEGHKFIGWYDADGKLISTDEQIELSGIEIEDFNGHYFISDFTGTARFE